MVGLADNRQLDIALEPILLKLQLPIAINLRSEARHHHAEDGVTRHREILAALETNDATTVLAALEGPQVAWAANPSVALGYLFFGVVCVLYSFLPGAKDPVVVDEADVVAGH